MRKTNKVSRNERLNGEFQKEIYDIITRRLKNPLITEMFSILRVDSSRDLSYAKVYISVFSTNQDKKMATFNAIKADAKKIRYELAQVIRARTVPELNFVLDDSMEYSARISSLINKVGEKG